MGDKIIIDIRKKLPRCRVEGKIAYDKKGAQTARNIQAKHGLILRIYACQWGNHFHLTGHNKRGEHYRK